MDVPETQNPSPDTSLPNGAGAAAVLSAGIGSFALAVIVIASDRILDFRRLMTFYRPTGPLSGATTSAIVLWLVVWALLHARWHKRNVSLRPVSTAAVILLALGFLLMFPPIADLF